MTQPDTPMVGESIEEHVRRLEDQVRELRKRESLWPASLVRRLLPPEARKHLRAAQRERLLAVRAVIDAAIQRTEESPRPQRPESLHIE
jgi:hypothetical protein